MSIDHIDNIFMYSLYYLSEIRIRENMILAFLDWLGVHSINCLILFFQQISKPGNMRLCFNFKNTWRSSKPNFSFYRSEAKNQQTKIK